MKHLALTITTTLATLAIILILWQLRSIVFLFLFSIIIAGALRRPIDRLIQRQFKPWLAMTIMYGVVLIGLTGLVIMIAMPLANEIDALSQALTQLYATGYSLVQSDTLTGNPLLDRLPSSEVVGQFLLENQPAVLVRLVLGFTQGFAFFVGQASLAIVLSIYWTVDQLHFERLWLSLLAPGQRTRMRDLWYKLEANVGAYIRSEVLQSVIAGGLLTLGFWLSGLSYPFLLAAIGAIAWFIPLVGALFAIPIIALIALLNGPTLAVAAAIYSLLIFFLMEFAIEPRLYDRSKYGAILVILVMMAMVDALGIIGLLLAPPLALAIQMIIDELLSAPAAPATVDKAVTLQDLQEQLAQVRTAVSQTETQSPRVKNMVERLEQLVRETQEATT